MSERTRKISGSKCLQQLAENSSWKYARHALCELAVARPHPSRSGPALLAGRQPRSRRGLTVFIDHFVRTFDGAQVDTFDRTQMDVPFGDGRLRHFVAGAAALCSCLVLGVRVWAALQAVRVLLLT